MSASSDPHEAPDDLVLVTGASRGVLLRAGQGYAGAGHGYAGAAFEVARHAAEVARTEVGRHGRALRIVVWSAEPDLLAPVLAGVEIHRAWDIAQAHRLLAGGSAAEPADVVALLTGIPRLAPGLSPQDDLFSDFGMAADAVTDDQGRVLPRTADRTWLDTDDRLTSWARLAARCAAQQGRALAAVGPRAVPTAWAESAAAVVCLELRRDGLPVDAAAAEDLIRTAAGPRPMSEEHERRLRQERDAAVLALAPGHEHTDLRNPAQVRNLLAAHGIRVESTRAHELSPYRHTHAIVDALLTWRKRERIATTHGYRWLDANLGIDGRLRGDWGACDGAAGRMTATAGLHSLPTPMRAAVVAEPGHVFVRADLGQIEPRVLAVVSGDPALAAATAQDDLYTPVSRSLGVDRSVAKVAFLAAMYGGQAGAAGELLPRLRRSYPQALALLAAAEEIGRAGGPLRTWGGRLIPLDWGGAEAAGPRGRFGRNAIVQGAAAELFKAWVATMRGPLRELGGQIVLCLHDEVLVHCPAHTADAASRIVSATLTEASRRWSGGAPVRFVADVRTMHCWAEAK